jgi:hypothetical protein
VPLLELPDPATDTHDRLVHALLVMRAKLGALAIQTVREADALTDDPHDPIARERIATASGLAAALDELDTALATAYGASAEHAEHVARHGRWISRVV